jgi:hypothetical protein
MSSKGFIDEIKAYVEGENKKFEALKSLGVYSEENLKEMEIAGLIAQRAVINRLMEQDRIATESDLFGERQFASSISSVVVSQGVEAYLVSDDDAINLGEISFAEQASPSDGPMSIASVSIARVTSSSKTSPSRGRPLSELSFDINNQSPGIVHHLSTDYACKHPISQIEKSCIFSRVFCVRRIVSCAISSSPPVNSVRKLHNYSLPYHIHIHIQVLRPTATSRE